MRPGRHDRLEARPLGPPPAHVELERHGEIAFGSPHQAAADQLLERSVGQRGGGPHGRHLVGFLDRTQALDQPLHTDQLDAVGQ